MFKPRGFHYPPGFFCLSTHLKQWRFLCETVLDQLYQAYAESHESDPPEISEGFKELEEFLCNLPLDDNNAVFNLCCHLCSAYERKAFIDGLKYGAQLIQELQSG